MIDDPDDGTGKIGPAQDFDSATERIAPEDASAFTWTPVDRSRTLSLWFYPTALPTNDGDPFQFSIPSAAPGNRYQWVFTRRGGAVGLACVVCDDAWNPLGYFGCQWSPQLDTWHHIAMVAGSSGNNEIYIDGQSQTVTEVSWDDAATIDPTTTAIKDAHGNSTGTGSIDEFRLSHCARSAGWIGTQYINQSDPASFSVIGAEESAGRTEVRLSSLEARWEEGAVVLRWRTASEIGTLEFRIHRRRGRIGPFTALSHDPVTGLGFFAKGREYAYRDGDVVRCESYSYLLEERDIWGGRSFHGPVGVDGDCEGIPDDEERGGFIRGDLGGDGRLDLGDIIGVLSHRARSVPPPRCAKILDLDDDGVLDLADALYGLRFLFDGGPPPPEPFPACGRGRTPDLLPCDPDSLRRTGR
ncbi:MAG: LamG-like jellyroll fold domain-containing protein [Planctomycetota bacterium]